MNIANKLEKFQDAEWVQCIQTIEYNGDGQEPTSMPRVHSTYKLLDIVSYEDYPDDIFLLLEGMGDVHWNSDFFVTSNDFGDWFRIALETAAKELIKD